MRQIRINLSTGVVEVNYPNTMTTEDVKDLRDAMAVTFRTMERTATNGRRQEGETTGGSNITDLRPVANTTPVTNGEG